MMKGFFTTALILSSIALLTACGGGSNKKVTSLVATKGYLIDSPIAGVTYNCGAVTGTTTSTGEFECFELPVTFKVGEYQIGSINKYTSDTKVYPQDLLGLPRDNFTDSNLVFLARLLQSLDDDGDISQTITIPSTAASLLTNLTPNLSIEELANIAGVTTLVSAVDAINHLKTQINPPTGGGTSNASLGGANSPTQAVTTFVNSLTTRSWELTSKLGFGTDVEFINDGLSVLSISPEGLFSLKKADGSFHTWYFDSATDTNSFVGDDRSFTFYKGAYQINLSYLASKQEVFYVGFTKYVNSLPSYGWDFKTPIVGTGGGLSGKSFAINYNNTNLPVSAFTACDATDALTYNNHALSSADSWFWRKSNGGAFDHLTYFIQISANNPTVGKFKVRIVCGSLQEWSASGTAAELGASFDVINQTATFNNTVLSASFNVLGNPSVPKGDLSITLNGDLLQ